jgi:flavin-dependent dehydrogenase
MINRLYDVVIVGAGPAGCTVARYLSKNYRILLIDRLKFPRKKSCGGILVEESINFLKKLNIPGSLFSVPRYVDLKLLDWDNNIEIDTKRNFWNISRIAFDSWMLDLVDKDVQILEETRFVNLKRNPNDIKILIKRNGKKFVIRTKSVVGADGAPSTIREEILQNKTTYYITIQNWIKNSSKSNNFIFFIYNKNITDFYSWVIPKEDHLIIGSAATNKIEEKIHLLMMGIKKKLNITGESLKKEYAMILRPRSEMDIALGSGKILLAGEAAGLISPSTGEGISFALRSGFACAQALNTNFNNPLPEYQNLCLPLILEIKEKIKKSKILSNPQKRMKMFQNL